MLIDRRARHRASTRRSTAPRGGTGARRRRLCGRSRPGRSAHPSPSAGSGGGRDHRDRHPGRVIGRLHGRGGHAQHRAGAGLGRGGPERARAGRRRPPPRWRWPGRSPWAGPASGWPRWPSWPTWVCACSPTTAPGCSRPASCAGPSTTPRASGSPWPSTARTGRWPPTGAMHEGEWSSRLGIPGMPAVAEEVMVARDIALVRATGARIHFLHLSTAGVGGHGPPGQGRGAGGHRRGGTPPLHPHRRLHLRVRPRVQGQSSVAAAVGRRRGQGRAWPTGPSTPSPPTTPPIRPSSRTFPSTRRPRACSACRRRSPVGHRRARPCPWRISWPC